MCGVGAGVGAQCVCCLCVARLGTRKTTVCRSKKTSPCVGSHGDVFNLHAGRREGRWGEEGGGGSLLSLSLFPSHFLSLPSFSLSSLFPLLSSLFSLSSTMTMITRPVGSLCVHTALTCLSARVPVLWLIPCLANMFVSCTKQLSWFYCESLVPLGVKWACICAGNGCCVWWCL